MIPDKEAKEVSRFLSLVLRHSPEKIGITLDNAGWVNVSELVDKLRTSGHAIQLEDLEQIVATNNKKRFAFSDDGSKIRASQGHSIELDLGYEPSHPPTVLYHGTAEQNLHSILGKGLIKGSRQHVHLSAETATAVNVGSRHGKPVVVEVAAAAMHNDGYLFYVSANGVWLTDAVPPQYLRQ